MRLRKHRVHLSHSSLLSVTTTDWSSHDPQDGFRSIDRKLFEAP